MGRPAGGTCTIATWRDGYAPSSSSFTSLAMRFSSARIILSSSRDRTAPDSSTLLLRPPKHIVTTVSSIVLPRRRDPWKAKSGIAIEQCR